MNLIRHIIFEKASAFRCESVKLGQDGKVNKAFNILNKTTTTVFNNKGFKCIQTYYSSSDINAVVFI